MVFEAPPAARAAVRIVPNLQEAQAVLRAIERAAMRRPGMKCARLLRMKPDFFAALQAECLGLTAADTEAAQRDKTHLENWIGHYGVTVQTRIDKMLRKGTLDPAEWPRLHALTQAFAPTLEMKINGVAPDSGIPHHEEANLIYRDADDAYYVQARFHLPLLTNPQAEIQLGGEAFHFAESEIYFFNKGVVHAARNKGQRLRYHLVWDAILTSDTYVAMFDPYAPPPAPFLERVPLSERPLQRRRRYWSFTYAVNGASMAPYRRLGLKRWKVPKQLFRDAYVAWHGRRPLKMTLAESDWPNARTLRAERDLKALIEKRLGRIQSEPTSDNK